MSGNLDSTVSQHEVNQDFFSLADGEVRHGLCEKCKVLDFGKHVDDGDNPGFSNFSRQFQLLRDIHPTDCHLCATRARLLDFDMARPHEIHRYVPVRKEYTENIDDLRGSGSSIDKLVH